MLLATLERVLIEARYCLEWVPGALTGQDGGTPRFLTWLSRPEAGAWLVLPIDAHGLLIATGLVREPQRPLVDHLANCFYERRRIELGADSCELQPHGGKRPRPTGLETEDPNEITKGGGEDRLQ